MIRYMKEVSSYRVSSLWAGKYAKTKHGHTSSLLRAIRWTVVWSIIELIRVWKLNIYHYGNILAIGKRKFIRCNHMQVHYECWDYNISGTECEGCLHVYNKLL